MKHVITLCALFITATLPAEIPNPDTPEGRKFIEDRKKCGDATLLAYPQLNDPNSPLRQEAERITRQYMTYPREQRQILELVDTPLRIVKEAERILRDRQPAQPTQAPQEQWNAAINAVREQNRERNSTVQKMSDNPLDDLASVPGPVGDVIRRDRKYPPLPFEKAGETEARQTLLELRDKASANGTLTQDLEFKIAQELAKLAIATAARRANEKESDDAARASEQLTNQLWLLRQQLQQLQR